MEEIVHQKKRDVEEMQMLLTKKGEGETSYVKNSTVQRQIMSVGFRAIEKAIVDMIGNNFPDSVCFADLGCSSGPNTLHVSSFVINVVFATASRMGCPMPELRVLLNDLPWNDFNQLFLSLPAFLNNVKEEIGEGCDRCFWGGVPGSFYGRLFPANSLHIVHSSSSLHWLSQVPPTLDKKAPGIPLNKGNIYISLTSPDCVCEAYLTQFNKDFTSFLKSRYQEVVPGGHMVLSFMGRRSSDPCAQESYYQWELLAKALMSMASEGLIEEDTIDRFNAPYYAPSIEELRSLVKKEGSFVIKHFETYEVAWDGDKIKEHSTKKIEDAQFQYSILSGLRVANTVRAVVEPMIEFHFGGHIVDELFQRYKTIVDQHLSFNKASYINFVVSLVRKIP